MCCSIMVNIYSITVSYFWLAFLIYKFLLSTYFHKSQGHLAVHLAAELCKGWCTRDSCLSPPRDCLGCQCLQRQSLRFPKNTNFQMRASVFGPSMMVITLATLPGSGWADLSLIGYRGSHRRTCNRQERPGSSANDAP